MQTQSTAPFDSTAFLSAAGEGSNLATYRKDGVIFSQGDKADAIFHIRKGKVKVAVLSPDGKEGIIAVLGAGDFLGEGCVANQPKRMGTASAICECSVVRVAKPAAIRALQDDPEFSNVFLRYVISRTIRIEEDLVDHLFHCSEKRLARVLLLLAKLEKKGDAEPVLPRMSQETLAGMVGTTRPRVSFFMNKFRRLGLISYTGKIESGGIEVHRGLLQMVL